MSTLKPQSNGLLYSNTVIGTLARPLMGGLLYLVQRGGAWAGYMRPRPGAWAGCGPAQSPLRCTKCDSLSN